MSDKLKGKHICFIATHLFLGGFTSSMISMIHVLQKCGSDVSVLLLRPDKNELDISVLNGVKIIKLPDSNHVSIQSYLHGILIQFRLHFLRKKEMAENESSATLVQYNCLRYALMQLPEIDLSGFDTVISWEELTCNYYLSYKVKASNKIGYVHPDYLKSCFNKNIDIKAFRYLDYVNSVSENTLNTMLQVFPSIVGKMRYVQNVMDISLIRDKAMEFRPFLHQKMITIVTVCRLDIYHKGLDRVAHIAKKLKDNGCKFVWTIVGEGEGRLFLENYIRDNGLEMELILEGAKQNPYPYILNADIFVLLSNYEGRPIVIDEAMILGTPVLVTNYESALEQVGDDFGIVVKNDENSAFEVLLDLLKNTQKLRNLKDKMKDINCSKFTNIDVLADEIRS